MSNSSLTEKQIDTLLCVRNTIGAESEVSRILCFLKGDQGLAELFEVNWGRPFTPRSLTFVAQVAVSHFGTSCPDVPFVEFCTEGDGSEGFFCGFKTTDTNKLVPFGNGIFIPFSASEVVVTAYCGA
jgi:hypothetical protein